MQTMPSFVYLIPVVMLLGIGMVPLRPGVIPSGPTIFAGTTVEDAVRTLALAPEGDVTVVSASGKPLGAVTFRRLAEAMVNAHETPAHHEASLSAVN
ncbi:ABC transporter [Pseudomonas syringae pv. actinidiae ICMP 19103]|nr:ABC transporter [Pseudomonas syringae pv. actinidiae ICMP 9853]EGH64819.1 ABC transporter-like protein [Pseudomonas syringae pv. actinidiae str. M302091]EPM42881.1 ABC transporter [Pseudomonas syringae pv. actinidiae ICMP 19103]EPM81146.1 ABC transporter [Pseudomonas syringae pv. actinidiae ICMP 19068]EPM90956.1 ABC transporter [Pseudomonas syringae pv. actinidiae ICMP 19070]EPM92722.1 ABC transporter [Pseudomonas syringae pv. actinidiae ICMP 19104]EPM99863.1 ABC transporter [Pseudomonas s